MAKNCPNCDKPLREGAKFCTACGHVLQKQEAPPPVARHPHKHLFQRHLPLHPLVLSAAIAGKATAPG